MVITSACHAEGRGFESRRSRQIPDPYRFGGMDLFYVHEKPVIKEKGFIYVQALFGAIFRRS
jgi:hypothetical protein